MAQTALLIYCSFWLLGFLFLSRIPSCKKKRGGGPQHLKVSIIIPARDEEHNLPNLLTSLGKQTFRPEEILVIDDHSEDKTAVVAREAGAKVLQSANLPPGWQGKPWACWQGAKQAQGDIFVFLDADTTLHPEGLRKIVDTYLGKQGVLSVQPYHRMEKLYEQLSAFFNIIVMAGLNAFTLLGTRIRPSGAFGPCIVIGKDDYFRIGGHEKVKGHVLEDIALGKVCAKEGVTNRCFGGKGAISFRMYPGGLRQVIEGHSKGFAQGAAGISFFALVMIIFWIAGGAGVTRIIITALVLGNTSVLLPACLLYAAYAVQLYWMLARIGSFRPATALLFPIPLVFFLLCFFYSLVLTVVRKRVAWKGRIIDTSKERGKT